MKWLCTVIGGCLGAVILGTLAHAEIVISGDADTATNSAPSVPAPATSENKHSDTIEFLNGDVLHGDFLSVDAKTGARWQHPAMKDPIDIDLKSIATIKLEQAQPTAKASSGQSCSVRLSNRDQLYGELVSMDATNLQLNTWYGGTLNIPRQMIEAIVPGKAGASLVYDGPTGMEGWTSRGGGFRVGLGGVVTRTGEAWTYSDKAFLSSGNGSLGHSFNFPPSVNIEFDLAWTGYLQMALSLFSDSLEGYGNGNGYLVQFTQSSIYLQRISRAGDSSMLGNIEAPTLARKNNAHFSLRVNREKKTIALVLNGALLKEWKDPGNFFTGTNLVFHQQGQARLKLSGLKISPWDGKFETPDDPGSKTKEDMVKLSNGDKISGTLKGIQSGKMNFQTAFAALEVPLDRISGIEMAGEETVRPPASAGLAHLMFLDHGSISFNLDRWDAQQITGKSPILGQVKLNPAAFGEIQFNAGQKKTESEESAMGGPGPDEIIIDKN